MTQSGGEALLRNILVIDAIVLLRTPFSVFRTPFQRSMSFEGGDKAHRQGGLSGDLTLKDQVSKTNL